MPGNRKTSHSDLRKRLAVIGINLNRVYALQRPSKNVPAILVHFAYAPEVIQLCKAEDGVDPVMDFNPTATSVIGDPHLSEILKTDEQRAAKAKALYFNHVLTAATQARDPHFGLVILKHFNSLPSVDHHYVPDVILAEYIKLRPAATRSRAQAFPTASQLRGFDASNLFEVLNSPHSDHPTPAITENGSSGTFSTSGDNEDSNNNRKMPDQDEMKL
jgi:hypothetical protein